MTRSKRMRRKREKEKARKRCAWETLDGENIRFLGQSPPGSLAGLETQSAHTVASAYLQSALCVEIHSGKFHIPVIAASIPSCERGARSRG